jgi:hypothetical protein
METMYYHIANQIANKIIESNSPPPEYLLALLQTKTLPVTLDIRPATLVDLVGKFLLRSICLDSKIVVQSVEKREGMPIRNTSVYQHNFVTADGKDFNCVEVAQFPDSGLGMLWRALVEMNKVGCMTCAFGQLEFEEGMVCPNCQGNKLRRVLASNGVVPFRDGGWVTLQEIIGPERSHVIRTIVEFLHKFWMDEGFVKRMDTVLNEAPDLPEFGEYLGLEAESALFGIMPEGEEE